MWGLKHGSKPTLYVSKSRIEKEGYKKDIWKYEGLILGIQSKSRIENEGYKKDIWKYEGLILGIQ